MRETLRAAGCVRGMGVDALAERLVEHGFRRDSEMSADVAVLGRGSTVGYRLLGVLGKDGGRGRFPVSLRAERVDDETVRIDITDELGRGLLMLGSTEHRLFAGVVARVGDALDVDWEGEGLGRILPPY